MAQPGGPSPGLALAGDDPATLFGTAIRMRPLDGARSAAAVLRGRVGRLTDGVELQRWDGRGWVPPVQSVHAEVAHQAADLGALSWREIRGTVAATDGPPPWAPSLGSKPIGRSDAANWIEAVTAVGAYRKQYAVTDYIPMLGTRPSDLRPDTRAAYDYAPTADLYLARHLDQLDPAARDLVPSAGHPRRSTGVRSLRIGGRPRRSRLGRPRRSASAQGGARPTHPRPRSRWHVTIIEAQAAAHAHWRRQAQVFQACPRQLATPLGRQQRT